MKKLVLALTALSLIGGAASPSIAAACRDKHGKYIKCPTMCRDKHGKYIKCPKMCRDKKGHFKKCK